MFTPEIEPTIEQRIEQQVDDEAAFFSLFAKSTRDCTALELTDKLEMIRRARWAVEARLSATVEWAAQR